MRATWRIVMSGALLVVATGINAAEVIFSAEVDRARTTLARPIRLTLNLTHSEVIQHVPAPSIDLSAFEVSGQNEGSYALEVNGRALTINSWTYVLYGRKPGKFKIGPARLNLGGKVTETEQITVEFVRGRTPSQQDSKTESATGGGQLEDNLFIRVTPSSERVYVGQQVTMAYDLCSSFRIHDVAWRVLPKFSGFWVKDLFVAEHLDLQQETIGQAKFLVWPLRRHALFPTSSGTHEVQPLTVTCGIPRSNRGRRDPFDAMSIFDSPFFGRKQSVEIRSPGLSVEVIPLPRAARPLAFTGAVGAYSIDASADRSSVPVGEPVTLNVRIAGTGNIEAIVEPDVGNLEGFKVYEPKIDVQEAMSGDLYLGSKSFEYILIPERAGSLEIPTIQFFYFDPQVAEYRMVTTQSLRIDSRGAEGVQEEDRFELSRQEIEELGKDIRHIKPDVADLQRTPFLHRSIAFWSLQLLMPLAYMSLVLYQRQRRRIAGDEAYARRRRAKGQAQKKLRKADQLRKHGSGGGGGGEFYAEIQLSVLTFIADHLNTSAHGLTADSSATLLQDRGVPARLQQHLRELLEKCDFERFASAGGGEGEKATAMEEIQTQAEDLIAQLEEALRK